MDTQTRHPNRAKTSCLRRKVSVNNRAMSAWYTSERAWRGSRHRRAQTERPFAGPGRSVQRHGQPLPGTPNHKQSVHMSVKYVWHVPG
jgi:hypothetical protein